MVRGFSGFGFPKAHGAAFGLLAYQSTWLRVHYDPEFLCSLLNEQPMGFYPPDALVHEAQRRGIEVLPPDVNESDADCEIEREGEAASRPDRPRLRPGCRRAGGQGAGRDARRREGGSGAWPISPRERARARRSLELLAWSGACDSLVQDVRRPPGSARRIALWQLGVATPGRRVPGGMQLALPARSAGAARAAGAVARGSRCSPTTAPPG